MSNSAESKRLDKIELQLTPRQWAIRMADEMRRYPSREDFLKALGKGTFRQAPFIAPFFPLGEQAKERWPADKRREVELSGKLRTAFRSLTLLLANINNAIMRKADALTGIRARRPRLKLDFEAYRQLCREVLERDGWRCQWCGYIEGLQVHHIQPRSRLGDDAAENLIALCTSCHQKAHRQS